MEYARAGIRINAVGPGWIDTPLLSDYLEEASKLMVALQPMGRPGRRRGRGSRVLPSVGTGEFHYRELPSGGRRLHCALGGYSWPQFISTPEPRGRGSALAGSAFAESPSRMQTERVVQTTLDDRSHQSARVSATFLVSSVPKRGAPARMASATKDGAK